MAYSSKVGVLGGGQLGRMLYEAASPLALNVSIMDLDTGYPAALICPQFFTGDFNDYDDVVQFGKNFDVLTIEIEYVNLPALSYLETQGVKVYPQPSVLQTIVDKGKQKLFYQEHHIPTSPFMLVESKAEILALINSGELHFPFVQKLRTGGYDGRGVIIIKNSQDLENAFDAPSVIEDVVLIDKELAVIVARSESGETKVFPSVSMIFNSSANLVELVQCPGDISEATNQQAQKIALDLATQFQMVGLLAVEMFLTKDGEILVNEVAPRPHNSGHHTIEANVTSQFEQHWRAILNLPLGDTTLIVPAVMANILGEEGEVGKANFLGLEEVLKIGGVFPHIYGKKITKPMRKMGHLTILGETINQAIDKAMVVRNMIKVVAQK